MNTSPANRRLRALAIATLTGLILSPGLHAATRLKAGDAFPELSQFQLEGQLPAATKGKVVLVDFWASWCGPCKASFPVMEELHQKFGKDGLLIIAINLDDKRDNMEVFLTQHSVSFAVVRDAAKKLVGAVNIPSMPASFVLDREGKVVAVHQGFHGDETRKQYLEEIQSLLKSGNTQG
jgi:thiol-disulfide isomerase/thioredoxin